MRKVFVIVSALIGGYFLWSAFKFGRVLLIMRDQQIDGPMMVIGAVLAGVGIAFLALGWWLFRKPAAPPPTNPGPPPQP